MTRFSPLSVFACALGASALSVAMLNAADPSASVGAVAESSVIVGGAFTQIGQPRLALLESATGAWHGSAVRTDGVRTVVAHLDTFIVGGEFTAFAGSPRRGLAKLRRDGTLDPTWAPAVTGTPLALALQGNRLFVGGSFTAIDGKPRQNLACLDLASGAVSETWQADADGPVLALAANSSALIAGGSFLTINGQPEVRIARLALTDGATATNFTASADADIRTVAIRHDAIFVGGSFARIGSEDRKGAAKLDFASGAVDADWRCDVDGAVYSLSGSGDQIYLGGAFTLAGGQPRANLARASVVTGQVDAWLANTNEQVQSILETDGDLIYLGGRFTTINDHPANGLAPVLRTDGSVVSTWKTTLATNACPSMALSETTLLAATCPLAGPARTAIASIDEHGSILPTTVMISGSIPRVSAAIADGDWLIIGGDFTQIDGQNHVRLARVNRQTGQVDPQWRSSANGRVRTLCRVGDTLIVGGDFSELAGQPRAFLGSISLRDGHALPWSSACDSAVFALQPIPGPDGLAPRTVLVGGVFTRVNDRPQTGLALIQIPGGSVEPRFAGEIASAEGQAAIHAITLLPDGSAAIGGRFTSYQGKPAHHLQVIAPTTGAAIGRTLAADDAVYALATTTDQLIVGGAFSTLNGSPSAHLGIVSLQGDLRPWRAAPDGDVHTLAVRRGELWIGGDFSALGHEPALHLARCRLSDGSILSTPGVDARVELLLGQ